jgi:tetratricopeptide (TPR) repeat protein
MELTLVRHNDTIDVNVNGAFSHAFQFGDVAMTETDAQNFARDPRPYGARLCAALLRADARARRELEHAATIELVIADPDLQRVPWEYLYDGARWLALDFSMTRQVKDAPAASAPSDGAHVLVVASDPLVYPNDTPVVALNIARERANLKTAFAGKPYRVQFIAPPTLDALHKQLAAPDQRAIIHFIGHGIATADGARLLFQDNCGIAQSVPARDFVAPMRDRAWLVFLNACQSATTLETSASNLAHDLARAGVPYVVAMQFSVPEIVALRLSEFFYTFLAQGNSVEQSVLAARRALARDENLARTPAGDVRAFALGIAVVYSAHLSTPLRSAQDARGEIIDPHPHAEYDTPIQPPQKFRGRIAELVALGRLFENGYATQTEIDDAFRREGRLPAGARVIVIRGEGGIGKSTLARRAVEFFDWRFPDGILGISFEILPSKDGLIAKLGRWLWGNAFDKLDESAREGAVRDELRRRRALILADNFETLIEGVAQKSPVARQLAPFLASIAGGETVLLITTRAEVKGFANAREILLEGLDADEARALFWDFASARYREPDESLAAQLVEKVGGHPLAIELLAHAFSDSAEALPEFLRGFENHLARAENLYKSAERQQTLAGCFDYSFAFLPAPAQAFFPKLKLFAAPFLADAVKFIFQADDAATLVNLLRQKSFVRAFEFAEDTPLYYLHPTARWYAEEREKEIEGLREKEIGTRYGEWYARIANAGFASFAGKTNLFDVALARASVPDLMAAREWMQPDARVWHSFRIAYLFRTFGTLQEGLNALDEAAAIADKHKLDKAKSSVLFEMANIFVTRGDLDRAMQLYQQSLQIKEQLGDLKGKSATLHQMAGVFVTRGDLDRAMQLYQQSASIDEQLGDLQGKSATLHEMANIFVTRGDLDRAMQLYQQSLQIKEQLGDLKGKSATLHQMADVFVTRGDLDQAMQLYRQSLQIKEQLGDLQGKSATLHQMADVFVTRGDLDQAMQLYRQSLQIIEQLGDLQGKSATLHQMAGVFVTRGDLDQAMQLYQQSLQIIEQLGDLQGKIRTLANVAVMLDNNNQLDEAIQLYIEALRISHQLSDQFAVANVIAMMSSVLVKQGKLQDALKALIDSLNIAIQLQAMPLANSTANRIVNLKQQIGAAEFAALWAQVTGNTEMPEWLR